MTQQSSLPSSRPSFSDFHPIILCTASRRVRGAEISEAGYIQGAADDHEAWAHRLTPTLFWKHKDLLMEISENDASSVIERLISEETTGIATATLIKPTSNVYVASGENLNLESFDVVISCTPTPIAFTTRKAAGIKHYHHLECQTGKLGSRDLRSQLSQLPTFLGILPTPSTNKILVCCPTGKDLSVGTALAILCMYADDYGTIDTQTSRATKDVNKNFIKQRLAWITTSNPALNPSRATLQSVNAVLLESQAPKPASARPNITTMPIRPSQHVPRGEDGYSSDKPPQPSIPASLFSTIPTQTWNFTRTLTSAVPTHPSGTVVGTATFTPCTLPSKFPTTLLYAETGIFTTTQPAGLTMTTSRKYVYQLIPSETQPGGESLEFIRVSFFADDAVAKGITQGVGEDGKGIGALFVEMGDPGEGEEGGVWTARNKVTHLCGEDLYTASWRFGRGMLKHWEGGAVGDGERWWEVKYDVKGPKKDYVSWTRYMRAE